MKRRFRVFYEPGSGSSPNLVREKNKIKAKKVISCYSLFVVIKKRYLVQGVGFLVKTKVKKGTE
jgi:hypothetical protein